MDADEVLSEVHLYVKGKSDVAQRTEFPVILTHGDLSASPDDDEDIAGRPSPKRFIVYHSLSTKLGDVGCQVWPASLLLADWVVHTQLNDGSSVPLKTVLELGAGIGLPSLVAAACGANVLLTDYNVPALHLAERSLQANADWIKSRGGSVKVCQLDWIEGETALEGSMKDPGCSGPHPCFTDAAQLGFCHSIPAESRLNFHMTQSEWRQALSAEVVLAADVLYDDHITDSFCKFLCTYLRAASKWRLRHPATSSQSAYDSSCTPQSCTPQSTHTSLSMDKPRFSAAIMTLGPSTGGPRVIMAAEKRYIFTIEHAEVRAPAFERFMTHVRLVSEQQVADGVTCVAEGAPDETQPVELLGRFLNVDDVNRAVMGTRRSSDLVLMEVWLNSSA